MGEIGVTGVRHQTLTRTRFRPSTCGLVDIPVRVEFEEVGWLLLILKLGFGLERSPVLSGSNLWKLDGDS